MFLKLMYMQSNKQKYRGVFEIQKSGDKTSSSKAIANPAAKKL